MLHLTTVLLRGLVNDVPEAVDVAISTTPSKFVDTVTDAEVEYCGFRVPTRLLQWYKSPVKSEAVRGLASDSQSFARLGFCPSQGGVHFYIKRSDKKSGYYSPLYRTMDEAMCDIDLLLKQIGCKSRNETNEIITQARDEMSATSES